VLDLRPARYDHPDAVELTERVQRYYVDIYGGPDADPLTADMLTSPSGGFVIGYLDDQPVAMGGWLWAPSEGARTAQIRRMYVDPSVRRRGVGRRLLGSLEADAADHGAEWMILTTGRPQTDAIALYRAAGYCDIAPFGHYADAEGAVHLGKRLEARRDGH
jgi:ribosomal protein S18 acetylase RimI-like enzyme